MRSNYLQFGGASEASGIDQRGTREYLESLGFGNGELQQARDAIEATVERSFTFEAYGANYCDFCFVRIMGGDYEHLKDGRDRCSKCSKTVMNSHESFVDEYHKVTRNMEAVFGITVDAPALVKMVNAKEIARQTGERVVSSPGVDPRVLGFVTGSKDRQELWIENGSPRMAAITTMAHELTHVWQKRAWDESEIARKYGKKNLLFVYEGMATWAQVQYLLATRELDYAIRQHAYAMMREDEYGIGYQIYLEKYPLEFDGEPNSDTPFMHAFPL